MTSCYDIYVVGVYKLLLIVVLTLSTTVFPNKWPAPLGFTFHSFRLSSGSLHNRSLIGPSFGTSICLLS